MGFLAQFQGLPFELLRTSEYVMIAIWPLSLFREYTIGKSLLETGIGFIILLEVHALVKTIGDWKNYKVMIRRR